MGITSVFPQDVFPKLGLQLRDSVLQTWIVMIVLVGLAFLVRNKYRSWDPPRWQLAIEFVVEYIENLVVSIASKPLPELVPFLTTMISFIAISNLLGLVPVLQAPTRDLNTTIALSLVSLVATQYYGIRRRGLKGYWDSLASPVFMLPLSLLGWASRLLSMSLRLFGNIMAGEVIGAVMFDLLPVLGPLPMNLLGAITSVLQALVFTVLTLVFTVDAMGAEDASSAQLSARTETA